MSEFDSKDFGERIKNYRIKKGLSQEMYWTEPIVKVV